MAIFGILDFDSIVQVDEKIRLDASRSFITKDESAITLVEIEPYAGFGFVEVYSTLGAQAQEDWYLDTGYTSAGSKVVSVRITTDGLPSTFTFDLTVLSVSDDNLFSSDNDLKAIEPDVMKWLPAGKTTWNFIHRKAQDKILTEIYKSRILGVDGEKLTKDEVIDKAEVREWSTYLALSLIYNGISNAVDDVFSFKSSNYSKQANQYMNFSLNILKLDYDRDGSLGSSEKLDFRTGLMVRR